MTDKRSFSIPYSYNNIQKIKAAASKIMTVLDAYSGDKSPSEMRPDDISSVVYLAEKIALTGRNFSQNSKENIIVFDEKSTSTGDKNLPVNVTFDGSTLRVFTPLTFKRFYRDKSAKENYQLMNYVSIALKKWSEEHDFDLWHALKPPLVVVIKRKANVWNRNSIPDADNIENGRVINEIIVNTFGYSDNAMNMSIISTFAIVPDPAAAGTEFIVFPKADLAAHYDEI